MAPSDGLRHAVAERGERLQMYRNAFHFSKGDNSWEPTPDPESSTETSTGGETSTETNRQPESSAETSCETSAEHETSCETSAENEASSETSCEVMRKGEPEASTAMSSQPDSYTESESSKVNSAETSAGTPCEPSSDEVEDAESADLPSMRLGPQAELVHLEDTSKWVSPPLVFQWVHLLGTFGIALGGKWQCVIVCCGLSC
jgi:hypothetical protein